VGLSGVAAAAGPDGAAAAPAAKKPSGGSWWNPWASDKEPDKKALPKANREEDKKAAARADKDLTAEAKPILKLDATSERAREQETLLRRLAVCDQLRMIANQKHDDALMRKAEELDTQIWDLYTRRVAHLPASQAVAGAGDLDLGIPPRSESKPIEVSTGNSNSK